VGERKLQRVTVFDKPGPEHSTTEVGVFGIGPAGWKFLEDAHLAKKRYGWDASPLQAGEGVYSVARFLEHHWRELAAATKASLLFTWFDEVLCESYARDAIEADLAQKSLTQLLGDRQQDPQAQLEFLKWAAGQKSVHHSDAFDRARAKVAAIESSGSVAQARFESKRGLVDLLQENIKRHYARKPLIPVFMALRKIDSDSSSHFVPDMGVTIAKTKEYTTDREIRMIYKLIEEIPDADIRGIARRTFFFQEQDARDPAARTFTTIPRPWDALDTDYSLRSTQADDNFDPAQQARWATRTRKDNRAAYHARAGNDVPLWIRELIEVKRKAAAAATA